MHITDDNVQAELLAHNPEALSFLIENFAGAVYALAARILKAVGTPEDTEECISDVFAKAWQRADQYDGTRGSIRTWLLILTKYQALETRKRLIRQQHQARASMDIETLPVDSGASPVVAEVLSRERQSQLADQVRAMDRGLREVFIRRYFLHTPIDELAETLGISRSTVDNRLWRARKWLRQRLTEIELEGGPAHHDTTGSGTRAGV